MIEDDDFVVKTEIERPGELPLTIYFLGNGLAAYALTDGRTHFTLKEFELPPELGKIIDEIYAERAARGFGMINAIEHHDPK